MKAIVYTVYGPPEVLVLKEIEKPVPRDSEILIRVRAVSVNYGDLLARNFKSILPGDLNMPFIFWFLAKFAFGFNKPKRTILGNSFSGDIVELGKGVRNFNISDEVFGYVGEKMGAYAEYICISEFEILALKPSNMTFEEAASVPYGAIMALCLLKKVNIEKGQEVLISGASGAIGSAAVQLLKQYYHTEVTGVCGVTGLDYVKILGADKVMDYANENTAKPNETYDIIFDILGKGAFSQYRSILKENGTYLLASFKTKKLMQMLWTWIVKGKRVVCGIAVPKATDLVFIKELCELGKMKAYIDKTFPLEQAAEAHRYAESGIKRGNVVITV